MIFQSTSNLEAVRRNWLASWEKALEAWSRFTKLAEPHWCLDAKQEAAEGLSGSFAMIRLQDHAVVISLRQVIALHIESFGVEIMAHEIGHHVYAPADLRDNARLIARIQTGLPTREHMSGITANLYTDLLINDRLQRQSGLDMAGVYRAIRTKSEDKLWLMYMRIYEMLWTLPPNDLAIGTIDNQIRSDAALGAKLIRAYAKDWLDGAGRFAALCLPYFLAEEVQKKKMLFAPWLDTQQAGAGQDVPDGLTEIEADEIEGAIHPAEDPDLTGLSQMDAEEGREKPGKTAPKAGGRAKVGGQKNNYRDPQQYTDLMKSLGVDIPEDELVIRYYRERARPYLVKFPVREAKQAVDQYPEGLDVWEVGSPLSEVDWTETVTRSPVIIPGVTTVERLYGTAEGHQPERTPVDLYLGVDCSGSMANPKSSLSYPVLAGTIIALSARRAKAKVMVTLSGEPGEYKSTEGFIRDEKQILKVLTGYLGTGYAFGILRLKDTFLSGEKYSRPIHILIVTDQDIFHMMSEVRDGWRIAQEALIAAGGGGTFVLNIPVEYYKKETTKLEAQGWQVYSVTEWEDLVAFAKAFSKAKYENVGGPFEKGIRHD